MVIFRSIKGSLVFLGIRSPQAFGQFHRFNLKNSMIFIYFIASTTLMGLSFIYDDGNVAQYSSVTFGVLSSAVSAFFISTLIWKTGKVYNLIDHFEDLVRKREYFPKT